MLPNMFVAVAPQESIAVMFVSFLSYQHDVHHIALQPPLYCSNFSEQTLLGVLCEYGITGQDLFVTAMQSSSDSQSMRAMRAKRLLESKNCRCRSNKRACTPQVALKFQTQFAQRMLLHKLKSMSCTAYVLCLR